MCMQPARKALLSCGFGLAMDRENGRRAIAT